MKRSIQLLSFLLLVTSTCTAQKYIIFERIRGLNSKEITANLKLSQNEIALGSQDTTAYLFNFYFTPQLNFKWSSLSPKLSDIPERGMLAGIIVTAAPIIKPGGTLQLQKMTTKELAGLNTIDCIGLLEETVPQLRENIRLPNGSSPSLKSFDYGIIIKDDNIYYKVNNKVLTSKYITNTDKLYFPYQFRSGMLNLNPSSKTYNYPEMKALFKDLNGTGIRKDILNRTYLLGEDRSSGFDYVFSFWEYLDWEGPLGKVLKQLKQSDPGLSGFDFLSGIGIINCTLDYYLKNTVDFGRKPSFKISSINGLSLSDFQKVYKDSLPKKNGIVVEQ